MSTVTCSGKKKKKKQEGKDAEAAVAVDAAVAFAHKVAVEEVETLDLAAPKRRTDKVADTGSQEAVVSDSRDSCWG